MTRNCLLLVPNACCLYLVLVACTYCLLLVSNACCLYLMLVACTYCLQNKSKAGRRKKMVCLFIYCPCLGDVGDSDASGADLLTAASGLFTHASFSARFSHADGLFIATQWGTAEAEFKAPSVERPRAD